jgi:hypothetical protein
VCAGIPLSDEKSEPVRRRPKRHKAPALRAEQELLALLAGAKQRDFTITVSVQGGHWIVNIRDPSGSHHGTTGEGATFVEAWLNQRLWWV